MESNLANFTDILGDEIENSQPLSLPSTPDSTHENRSAPSYDITTKTARPPKRAGQHGDFRSVEEIDPKYRDVFTYPYFNLVQSGVIEDALYSDKSMVVCAPTGSGKTVVFEMAIVQLLMELEDKQYNGDFKIIYMAPVKALCTERLSEWYPKFTKLGLMCIEVTGDTNVDFSQLKPYRIIITTPEKWDMLTRRWRDHRSLVEVIKLFLIDEVHILNEETRGPVLEAVVSRMKTIESSSQAAHRIEKLKKQYQDTEPFHTSVLDQETSAPHIRFVAVSATISNPEDVAAWLGTRDKPAVYYKFGDECRPVKLKRVVEGYPCPDGMSIFKFDIILNYKLWPVIQKHHDGKPTLIFCNTRKSVALTAETLARELTVSFTPEQKAKLTALASTIKNKKLQALVLSGVGCHHAGLLYEERLNIEQAFRNRDLPILITTTTLAMGVNLPAHLVIIKNTQQYVNGAYQEYSISTILQMVGRAGRPQFDTEATAVIMTRLADKPRYQALVGGSEPLQSYLHKRLAENLNSEAALGTVCDVAQCVQWLRSTFLSVRAAKEPKRYLGLPSNAPETLISKKIEELCVKAMNGLASSGLITMDDASCIESTEAGRLMSIYYLDLETMKHIMKIEGNESLERLLWIVCESHELADMHLRVDERRTLNTLNRNNAAATIRFPMKGKINTRQMKLNCIIQAVLGCLPIPDPSLNQEAMKVMRIAHRVCKCLVAYVTRSNVISTQPQYYSSVLNAIILAKCIEAHMWENSPYVSKQLKGIGPTFSTLLATAGKVNFELLEQSHPRDLERIMNKGAPAGNVLKKQVGLLPKYQLTATPIDETRVSIRLMLLNQNYLAENREHLTAGDSHMCHIIIGDSENHLLLYTTFKDKDLISVFNGIINYEITRKHNFEHKIWFHCVSSHWVGIDVQCDYTFKNLEPLYLRGEAIHPTPIQETPVKKTNKKQTSITDVYKQRKRKTDDLDIAQSKEKKKRDNALIEKFHHLKNSFEITSKELKDEFNKTVEMSGKIIHDIVRPGNQNPMLNNLATASGRAIQKGTASQTQINTEEDSILGKEQSDVNEYNFPPMDIEDLDEVDEFIVNDRVNSILNDIENEMYKTSRASNSSDDVNILASETKNRIGECDSKNDLEVINSLHCSLNSNASTKSQLASKRFTKPDINKSLNQKRNLKSTKTKSNYSFIELLNKKQNTSSENEDFSEKTNGFSDAIKRQIELFLHGTRSGNKSDLSIKELLNYNTSEDLNQDQNLMTEYITLYPELPVVNVKNKKTNQDHTIKPLQTGNPQNYDTIIEINDELWNQQDETIKIQNLDVRVEGISQENIPEKEINHDSASVEVQASHTKGIQIENNSSDKNPKNLNNYVIPYNKSKDYYTNLESSKVFKDSKLNKEEMKKDVNETSASQSQNAQNINNCENINSNYNLDGVYKSESTMENSTRCISPSAVFSFKDKIPEVAKLFEDMSNDTQATKESDTSSKCTKTLSSWDSPLQLTLSNNALSNPIILENVINSENFYPRNRMSPHTQTSKPNCISIEDSKTDYTVDTDDKSNQINNYNTSFDQTKSNTFTQNSINRRSFTATKVDVYTKHTPEHKVQIIRELKLDIAVTEIVSQNDSNDKNKTQAFNEREKDVIKKKMNNNIKESENLKNTSNITSLITLDNEKVKLQNNVPPKKTQETREDVYLDQSVLEHKKEGNAKSNQSLPETKLKQAICVDKSFKQEFDQNTESCNDDKKIENILQKYSTVLRKNNVFLNNSAVSTNKQQNTSGQSPEKIKRPYKISEIHNLEVPLPKVLVTASRDPSSVEIETKESKDVQKFLLRRNTQTQKCETKRLVAMKTPESNSFEIKHDMNNINNYTDNILCTVSEIPELELPPLETLDFKIDQSMLNPKTLLQQCYPKEDHDEIIPPPEEFCDQESVYSPTQLQDCYNRDFDTQELIGGYEDDLVSVFDNDRSIFKENDDAVLTPSKEIETWTLTKGDDYDESFTPSYQENNCHSMMKSYTVMRQNSPVTMAGESSNSGAQGNFILNSRPAKLGKFKFMHKTKLKLK